MQSLACVQQKRQESEEVGVTVLRCNLRHATNKHELLSSIKSQFDLPEYMELNWDALEECLRDLPDAPGWFLEFDEPQNLEFFPKHEVATFISCLEDVGKFWKGLGKAWDVAFVGNESIAARIGIPYS